MLYITNRKGVYLLMNDYPLVSVYTCVYNGARTLDRVFSSMKKLDYPSIEHIIINDGSTDTTELLIQEYITQVPFVVKYYKKENGGKHTALNVAWELAEGKFMIQLDADDELLPHSVKFLVDTYLKIPENIRDQYWCVHGRCQTQTGEFVGDPYPQNINDFSWVEAGKEAKKYSGEKIGLQVRKYLREYKFPEVVGVSYLPEGIIWNQINKIYGTWYTNEVVRIYYVGEGGNLTAKKKTRRQFGSLCYWNKWMLMHPQEYRVSWKTLALYSLCYFIADKKFRKGNRYLEDLSQYSAILILLAPIAYMGAFALRIVKKIH